MICTAVNFVPAISVSAKEINQQTVSASDDEDYEDSDEDDGDDEEPVYKSGDYSYTLNDNGFATIIEYRGKAKNLTIPASLDGHKVTRVDSVMNEDTENSYTETLTIGNNVTEIGNDSCSGLENLKTVNIKKSVKKIESCAFEYNYELTKVTFEEGVKTIGPSAFFDCPELKTISLPNSVNRVGTYFFGYEAGDETDIQKIKGTTITGYKGSNVEKYASSCSITFKSAGQYKPVTNESNYDYEINDNGEADITAYYGQGGDVVVPEKLNGHNVCYIDNGVFSDDDFCSTDDDDNIVYYKNFDYIISISLPKNLTYYNQPDCDDVPKLNTVIINDPLFEFEDYGWGFVSVYDDNDEFTGYKKISGFTIKGLTNSSAELYAKENGIKFVSIGTYTPDVTVPEEPTTVSNTEPTTTTTIPTTVSSTNSSSTVTSTTSSTTVTSTTIPTRVVEYPTETAMEEPTYTVPTVADTNVYTEKVTLNKSKATLLSGKSTKLVATVTPSNAKSVTWSTSNPRVATVDNGVVKAIGKGQATITAKATDGTNLSAKCVVTVKQAVTSIKLNKTLITNKKGSKVKLTATVNPTKADNKIIKWQTSNKKVATVSGNGQVTVKGTGYAVITCNSGDGSGVKARCVVNNSTKAKSIKINKTQIKLNASKTYKLSATVNGKCKTVSYSSSNTKIAKVNDSGIVTGVENGKATIIAKTMDGSNKSAKCVVTVVGHNFGSWKVTENSTCVTEGVEQRTCNSCKKTETRKISKSTHTWDSEYTIVKEPTCTDSGLAVVKCKYCDEERNPYVIPALGHCYGESYVSKKATCTEDGQVTKKCKICGVFSTKTVSKLGHVWSSEKKTIKEATCQDTGIKANTCLYCNATSNEEVIPKTEHKFDIMVSDECSSPTCTTQGLYVYKCSMCGTKTYKVVEALGHHWDTEITIDKEPTCQTEGLSSIHCKRCNETKDEQVIPKSNHNFTTEKVIKQATLTADGVKSLTCKDCGFAKNDTIPKVTTVKLNATSFVYDSKVKKPTVSVTDSEGKKLVENTDYTLSGTKQATNIAEYTITVNLKGSYSGSQSLTYKIIPKGSSITSLTAGKNQLTAKWTKQSTQTTGYVIYYATKSDLSDRKYIVIKNTSTVSQTITGLTSNKKYYVAVRTIKDTTKDGKSIRYYSTVSPRKTVVVK